MKIYNWHGKQKQISKQGRSTNQTSDNPTSWMNEELYYRVCVF